MADIRPQMKLPMDYSDSEFNVWMQMVRTFKAVPIRTSCMTCGTSLEFYLPKGTGEPSRCKVCGKKRGEGFSFERVDAAGAVVRTP